MRMNEYGRLDLEFSYNRTERGAGWRIGENCLKWEKIYHAHEAGAAGPSSLTLRRGKVGRPYRSRLTKSRKGKRGFGRFGVRKKKLTLFSRKDMFILKAKSYQLIFL